MELLTATIVLCATLMTLWGATMLVFMSSDRPLVQVTVQVLNAQDQVPAVVRRVYGRA